MIVNITNSESETISLGERFVNSLKGGEIILLDGNLGAGKTTFVKGVARGLNIKRTVTSPTFVLMKIYVAKDNNLPVKKLIHLDAYRGVSENDLEEMGLLEFIGKKDTIIMVEWGRNIERYLKNKKFPFQIIKFSIVNNKRKIIWRKK